MFINSDYSSTYINSKYITATHLCFDLSPEFDSEDAIRDYLDYNRKVENLGTLFPLDDSRRRYITMTSTIKIICTNEKYTIYKYNKDVFNMDEYYNFIQEQREVYDNLIEEISTGDIYHIG